MREQPTIAGLDPSTIQAWGAVANAMASPAILRTHLRIGAGVAIGFISVGVVFIATFLAGMAFRLLDSSPPVTITDGVDLFLGAMALPIIGIGSLVLKRTLAGLRAIPKG